MRVKIVSVLLICMLLLCSCTSQAKPSFAYRGVSFGDTTETIVKANGEPYAESKSSVSYINDKVINGHKSSTLFMLDDSGKVTQYLITFTEDYGSGDRIKAFDAIDNYLSSAYAVKEATRLPVWNKGAEKQPEESYDKSITDGSLMLMSGFKDSGAYAIHSIQTIGGHTLHAITISRDTK